MAKSAKGFVAYYRRRLPTLYERIVEIGNEKVGEDIVRLFNNSLRFAAYFQGEEYRPVYRKWGVEHA